MERVAVDATNRRHDRNWGSVEMSGGGISEIETTLKVALTAIEALRSTEDLKYSCLRDLEIALRRVRYRSFPRAYFSDVAWDILLDLHRFEELGDNCVITDIGADTKIPLATIIRYINKMELDGFISRVKDNRDQRRSIVALTERGRNALNRTFEAASYEVPESLKLTCSPGM